MASLLVQSLLAQQQEARSGLGHQEGARAGTVASEPLGSVHTLIPQALAVCGPASFRGVAGAGLEISRVSVFLRVSLGGLTGSGSLRQFEGSSELVFLALESWTHGVITKTESSIWLYICKVHLQVFERGGFLVIVQSGLGKIWFA